MIFEKKDVKCTDHPVKVFKKIQQERLKFY